jgi:hypothetical protein
VLDDGRAALLAGTDTGAGATGWRLEGLYD